uniref:RGS domain-containing protein n=1 Tax=Timema tahoe TaxID=61484 RepID=A0A7R9IHN5_9NEOP|nr:unnamed protein product [Timema tahoe]
MGTSPRPPSSPERDSDLDLPVLGYLLFKDFCENVAEEPVPQLKFYEEAPLFNCCSSLPPRVAKGRDGRNQYLSSHSWKVRRGPRAIDPFDWGTMYRCYYLISLNYSEGLD